MAANVTVSISAFCRSESPTLLRQVEIRDGHIACSHCSEYGAEIFHRVDFECGKGDQSLPMDGPNLFQRSRRFSRNSIIHLRKAVGLAVGDSEHIDIEAAKVFYFEW